jgi:hypothetical protein
VSTSFQKKPMTIKSSTTGPARRRDREIKDAKDAKKIKNTRIL